MNFLQAERAPNESREDYVNRRRASHDFVQNILGGTVFWNPSMQGNYFNEERKTRPVGKSGRRQHKANLRMTRALATMSKAFEQDLAQVQQTQLNGEQTATPQE